MSIFKSCELIPWVDPKFCSVGLSLRSFLLRLGHIFLVFICQVELNRGSYQCCVVETRFIYIPPKNGDALF